MTAQQRPTTRVARRSPDEIEKLKAAGQVVGETLALLRERVAPDVSGLELDKLAEEHIRARGALPSFKGYRGYPATICMEIDEVVVHGIPNDMPLQAGQIVGIDLGACHRGFHGDAAISVVVGEADQQQQDLLDATFRGLMVGIAQARAGKKLKEISKAIQAFVEARGYSVVRQLVGHGIGEQVHEPPQVPNFFSRGEFGDYERVLRPGMVLAIEPMVNVGTARILMDDDGWTMRTADGRPSAHFEHTVVVTKSEPLILTLAEGARYLSDAQRDNQA